MGKLPKLKERKVFKYKGREVSLVRRDIDEKTGAVMLVVQHTEGTWRDVIRVRTDDRNLEPV